MQEQIKLSTNTKVIIGLILFPVIFMIIFYILFYAPYGPDKVKEIMYEYVEENIPDYQNYQEVEFGIEDGVSNERGYAGYGKSYYLILKHKENSSLVFQVNTDGNKIVSNYYQIESMLPYLKIAEKLFEENIAKENVELIQMTIKYDYDFVNDNVPTEEAVLSHSQFFEPVINVKIPENENVYDYMKQLDLKVSQYFKEDADYDIEYADGTEKNGIGRYSIQNNSDY